MMMRERVSMCNLVLITGVIATNPYAYCALFVAYPRLGFNEDRDIWGAADTAAASLALAEPTLEVRSATASTRASIADNFANDRFEHLVRTTGGETQQRVKRMVVMTLGTVDADRAVGVVAECAAYASERQASLYGLMSGVLTQFVGEPSDLNDPCADDASALIPDFVPCASAAATPEQSARAATVAAATPDLFWSDVDAEGNRLVADLARAVGQVAGPATVLANGVGLLAQTFDASTRLVCKALVALVRGTAHVRSGIRVVAVTEAVRHKALTQHIRRIIAEPVAIADRELATDGAVLCCVSHSQSKSRCRTGVWRTAAQPRRPGSFYFRRRSPRISGPAACDHDSRHGRRRSACCSLPDSDQRPILHLANAGELADPRALTATPSRRSSLA